MYYDYLKTKVKNYASKIHKKYIDHAERKKVDLLKLG